MNPLPLRRALPGFRWNDVDLRQYKAEGDAPFRDVTRQVLFGDAALASELRYFEVGAGGWTTLERHVHEHAVLVLRGHGRGLVGAQVFDVGIHDLVRVPPLTWHQFRAASDQPLGFLCMVDATRDRPQVPDAAAIAGLRALPDVAAFLDP